MAETWSDLLPLSLDKMDGLKHDVIESKQMFLLLDHILPLSSDSALFTASFASVDHLKVRDTQQKLLSEPLPLFFQFMALFTALVIPVEHNSVHLIYLTAGTCFRTNRA